jgi:hypothetical protein
MVECAAIRLSFWTAKRIALALTQIVSIPLVSDGSSTILSRVSDDQWSRPLQQSADPLLLSASMDAVNASVVDWIAALGQLGGSSRDYLGGDRRPLGCTRRRRRRRFELHEEETLQARLITVELKLDSDGHSAKVTLTNNSAQPIFQPWFGNFSIWSGEDVSKSSTISSGLSSVRARSRRLSCYRWFDP